MNGELNGTDKLGVVTLEMATISLLVVILVRATAPGGAALAFSASIVTAFFCLAYGLRVSRVGREAGAVALTGALVWLLVSGTWLMRAF
jgi:hypothetical protein